VLAEDMEARLKPLVRRLPSETSSETSHVTTMRQLPSQIVEIVVYVFIDCLKL
jgi:hypothetical protein